VASEDLRRDRLERAIGVLRTHQRRLVEAMAADFGHRSEHQSLFTDVAGSIGPLRHAQKHLARWMRPQKRKVGPFPL
jgi:coniferyl-aldehyde dehydrogenase